MSIYIHVSDNYLQLRAFVGEAWNDHVQRSEQLLKKGCGLDAACMYARTVYACSKRVV